MSARWLVIGEFWTAAEARLRVNVPQQYGVHGRRRSEFRTRGGEEASSRKPGLMVFG